MFISSLCKWPEVTNKMVTKVRVDRDFVIIRLKVFAKVLYFLKTSFSSV